MFDADGAPRSRRYGDIYFSKAGGLAEARAVFLAGCGLPEAWRARRRYGVGELGFGTGLNVAALLDLWRAERAPDALLSVFSVEAEPLAAADAARALSAFPELASVAQLLIRRWPGRARGFHRVDLPELGATLDLAVMDAEVALRAWSGRADAWFLDGFSPAVNPRMWTDALMGLVAARSAPGARAATYTVAGQVRRALSAAGFSVARRPGFGGKRERLEAQIPGATSAERRATPRIAIVGAGIAGAALARAFRALGTEPRVFDADAPVAGASGMPAALVTPRLDAGLGGAAELHAQALARAVSLYDSLAGAVIARGVLQLEAAARDAARFAKIVASDLFEPGALELLTAEAVSERLAERAPAALLINAARVIEPAEVLAAWLATPERRTIAAIEPTGGAWRLTDTSGAPAAEADIVCVATGADLATLWATAPIEPVRGQLSWAAGPKTAAAAWGAYAAPTRSGMMFGATHDRGDASADWRPADDARNLATLAARLPRLAQRLEGARIEGRAAVRATTPDRLPIAGALAPGLFVLGGFGARGFALAPLLAEHIAAEALGAPSPLPAPLAAIVATARFAERARRRGGLERANPEV